VTCAAEPLKKPGQIGWFRGSRDTDKIQLLRMTNHLSDPAEVGADQDCLDLLIPVYVRVCRLSSSYFTRLPSTRRRRPVANTICADAYVNSHVASKSLRTSRNQTYRLGNMTLDESKNHMNWSDHCGIFWISAAQMSNKRSNLGRADRLEFDSFCSCRSIIDPAVCRSHVRVDKVGFIESCLTLVAPVASAAARNVIASLSLEHGDLAPWASFRPRDLVHVTGRVHLMPRRTSCAHEHIIAMRAHQVFAWLGHLHEEHWMVRT
jgi:hypothetical protein